MAPRLWKDERRTGVGSKVEQVSGETYAYKANKTGLGPGMAVIPHFGA